MLSTALSLSFGALNSAIAAETYTIDAAHTNILMRVSHLRYVGGVLLT